MKALAAGNHVLLEKRSANTTEETCKTIAFAQEKRLVLLEAFHSGTPSRTYLVDVISGHSYRGHVPSCGMSLEGNCELGILTRLILLYALASSR